MPFSMETFVDVVNPNTSDQHRNTYKRPDSGCVHLYIPNKHRGAVVARGAHNPKVHRSKRCDAKKISLDFQLDFYRQ